MFVERSLETSNVPFYGTWVWNGGSLMGAPPYVAARDPELIALEAADELSRGSFEDADRHRALATSELASAAAEHRARFQVTLGTLRLCLARQRGDLATVAEEAQQLLAPIGAADVAELGLSPDRRALALISLGSPRPGLAATRRNAISRKA